MTIITTKLVRMVKKFAGEIVLLLVLGFVCAENTACEWDLSKTTMGGYYAICKSSIKALMALYGIRLLLGRISKILLIPFVLISSLVAPLISFVKMNFNMEVTSDIVLIVLAATKEEINFFFDTYVTLGSAVALIAYVCLIILCGVLIYYAKIVRLKWIGFFAGLAMLMYYQFTTAPFSHSKGPWFHFKAVSFCYNLLHSNGMYKDLAEACKHPALGEDLWHEWNDTDQSPIFVFVLGESATRNHWGAYGYSRDTTPSIASASSNTIIFDDMITSWQSTQNSIYYIFTGASLDEQTMSAKYTFLDLLNKAGFETYLVSAQAKKGIYDTIISYIFSGAQRKTYLEDIDKEGPKYDGDLLPEVRKVINEKVSNPKFIIYHLNGSHVDPVGRYPQEKATFLPDRDDNISVFREIDEKLINAYDNSIRYTDSLVGEVIALLEKTGHPALLIYLSDHGESIHDKKWRVATDPMVWEVPFVIWYSDAYREECPELVEKMKKSKHKAIQSDQLISGLFSLMKIRGEKITSDVTNNFLEDTFTPRVNRSLKSINGEYREGKVVK